MSGMSKRLTALKVKSISSAGFYHDSDGLYLRVAKSGSKFWVYRYMLNGKRRSMGLGSYKELTLEQARTERNDQRKLVVQGVDPIDARNQNKVVEQAARRQEQLDGQVKSLGGKSFKSCGDELISKKKAEWRNEKHAQQWENTLRDYVYPHIGDTAVADVDVHMVLNCLTPIWTKKCETATRVRQRIESILNYAKVMGYRTGENPAVWKGNLEHILPNPSKVKTVVHHKAIGYDHLPEFYSKLTKMNGLAALALQLTILTASRTSEVLKAEIKEFDLESKIWTVPEARMKAGIEHRVALSDKAVGVVEAMIKLTESIAGKGDLLCPGMREGRPLSNVSMVRVLTRMKYTDITVHGFRSTFRDWVAEQTHFPARVAETALAHQLKDNAEKAYQRGDLLEKRFELMEAWASYCSSYRKEAIRLVG